MKKVLCVLSFCIIIFSVGMATHYWFSEQVGDQWLWKFDVASYSMISRFWTTHQKGDANQYILEWTTKDGHKFQAVIIGADNAGKLVRWLDEATRKTK